ncbi:MAG: hypothetical protein J7M26_05190, partial [Armatimonadetes bacterium]|nr:hypothetical protein [Armatimonadota bacterium]
HKVWLVTRERGSTDARRLALEIERALTAAGATVRRHPFFPYTYRERAWRKVLSPVPTSDHYLSLLEFYLAPSPALGKDSGGKEPGKSQDDTRRSSASTSAASRPAPVSSAAAGGGQR